MKHYTPEELTERANGLVAMGEAFVALNIPYFLEGGTLLGAIRDNDFIPWDWEAGVAVRYEDMIDLQYEFIALARAKGFAVLSHIFSARELQINLLRGEGREGKYEIGAWWQAADFRYLDARQQWKLPNKFFDAAKTESVSLRGVKYDVLSPPLEYLEYVYGSEWSTPRMTDVKTAYLTERAYSPNKKPGTRAQRLVKALVKLFQAMRSSAPQSRPE